MRISVALLVWLWGAAWVPAATVDVPAWSPKAPRLPPPRGEVIRVTTVDELFATVERAESGHTILLTDGDYKLAPGYRSSADELVYVADGIVRNNVIAGGSDCGIELWHTERIKVSTTPSGGRNGTGAEASV